MSDRRACLVVYYGADGTHESNEIVDIDRVNELCVEFNRGLLKKSFKAYDIGTLLASKSIKPVLVDELETHS
jgi:hypothetical protein